MQDSRAERAAKAGETASFSARGECALIRDHARGLQETALQRLATTTGNGFSATELAGKPVMVSKETGGRLHIVVARVMHCHIQYMILQLERCIKMMEMLVQLAKFALTVCGIPPPSLPTKQPRFYNTARANGTTV